MRSIVPIILAVLAAGCINNPPGASGDTGTSDATTKTEMGARDLEPGDAGGDVSGAIDQGCGATPAVIVGGTDSEVAVGIDVQSPVEGRCGSGVGVGLTVVGTVDAELQVVHQIGLDCAALEVLCKDRDVVISTSGEVTTVGPVGNVPMDVDPDTHHQPCATGTVLVGMAYQGTVTLDGGAENDLVRTAAPICQTFAFENGAVALRGEPQTGSPLNGSACDELDPALYACTEPRRLVCPDGMMMVGIRGESMVAFDRPAILCVPVTAQ